MINLKWYAAIGYGDILLPISYAHNLSRIFEEEVNIELLYKESVEYKYNENSKEFLWEQAEYLNSICDKSEMSRVQLIHRFKDTSKIRWAGYDQSLLRTAKFHDQWHINNVSLKKKVKKIVIGSTAMNKVPLGMYQNGKKMWKSSQDWGVLETSLKSISDFYEIVHIDYTTPLAESVDHLSDASLFIGYHGGMSWLARFCTTPSIVLSKPNSLTNAVFSNAMRRHSLYIRGIDHIKVLIDECTSISDKNMIDFANRNHTKELFQDALNKTLYVK